MLCREVEGFVADRASTWRLRFEERLSFSTWLNIEICVFPDLGGAQAVSSFTIKTLETFAIKKLFGRSAAPPLSIRDKTVPSS